MYYDIEWLNNVVTDHQNLKFLYFWGHTNKSNEAIGKFCFSQWYESPFAVDGVTYNTAEHWMMAKKALLFGDLEIFGKIVISDKPGEVKDLGRRISGFDDEIWTAERYEIVKAGNLHKFKQHPELSEYLLGTGNKILVEASPVDRIWGIGLAQDHADASNPNRWLGLNLLGFALMEVRDLLV
ncbi:NADAR family protein [Pedobacter sp. AW31-3R]|uniref:NADAR family protein n=1 Tax=Pedobacter sp. AW31-3R TaxID=3445781 RepID=UPI003FA030C6